MDRVTRYQDFLRLFRSRHGYMPAPSFEEWEYNIYGAPIAVPTLNIRRPPSQQRLIPATGGKTVWTDAEETVLVAK